MLELVAMVGNAISALLILIISACNTLPRLHIPWMIFSAFEITGNVCVSAALIILPGKDGLLQNKKYLLNLCRSPISDLYCVHDQGDVVEVGVGQGGQEADAQTD